MSPTEVNPDRPRWDEIWAHHLGINTSLAILQATVLTGDSDITHEGLVAFAMMTEDEVRAHVDQLRDEHELGVVLLLIAAFEAALRADVHERRRKGKRKREPNRTFRELLRRHPSGERLPLDELLDVWRGHLDGEGKRRIVSEFKQVLEIRHWLAHGRWWIERDFGALASPLLVRDRGVALLEALELLEPEGDDGADAT